MGPKSRLLRITEQDYRKDTTRMTRKHSVEKPMRVVDKKEA